MRAEAYVSALAAQAEGSSKKVHIVLTGGAERILRSQVFEYFFAAESIDGLK